MKRFFVLLALLACCDEPPSDEARIGTLLGVPADAKLVSLDASPAPGGLQREGLRIVAEFHVASGASRFSSAPWSPLPLPPNVASFRRPPTEIVAPAAGTYRCEVGVYAGGSSHATFSCASPPARFDMYQLATFDPATGTLRALVNYYY